MTRHPVVIIDIMPFFKAGDPKPEGYLEWHEWAEVQLKAGAKQQKCPMCGLWRFPQEKCCVVPEGIDKGGFTVDELIAKRGYAMAKKVRRKCNRADVLANKARSK